jgi:alcohol dehydrogenase YqhD (iron-dependent ADH family)
MIDFDFVNPTRIIFGHNSEDKIGDVLKGYGFSKVLLVYGGGSIKKSGLYDHVVSKLQEAGISFCELGGVMPNPDRLFVIKGRDLAKKNGVNAILAIGGGSVIDIAKSIGVSFYYEGDPFDFNLRKATPDKTLPVGVILTIASAGSESSDSCVISDYETKIKQGFNNNIVRPLFAIEDPELTYSVSAYQTAVGVTDIMMHSLERYFGPSDGNQLADEWALDLCRNVMDSGIKSLQNPFDFDARAAMMLDSSLSHDGLTAIGKKTTFVVHPLEHALSGLLPSVTHGAGIAVCYLGWSRYVYKIDPTKFAKLGRRLFNIYEPDDLKAAIMGINAMRDFYISIGMPTSLKEVGIQESNLPELARLASGNGTHVIGCCPQSLNERDIEAVYRLCL